MSNVYMGPVPAQDALVGRTQRGDLDAYNELVRRHQLRAYNLAYRLLGNAEDAADATQESFIKAYQRIGQFRGGAFKAWLLKIVTNTCYDALRSRRRQAARTIEIDDSVTERDQDGRWRDPGATPEDCALRQERLASIQAASEGLPFDQRTVLILSDIEGFHYEEIAEILAVPMGTVKSRLARARAHVRDMIESPGQRAGIPEMGSGSAHSHEIRERAGLVRGGQPSQASISRDTRRNERATGPRGMAVTSGACKLSLGEWPGRGR